MVVASIFLMVNEFKHVSWIEGLAISIHPICIDFYISLKIFVRYGFPKFLSTNILSFKVLKYLSTNILSFKEFKYVSPQKLTFLVQNTTLKKSLQ
jgi:hypothetical protein